MDIYTNKKQKYNYMPATLAIQFSRLYAWVYNGLTIIVTRMFSNVLQLQKLLLRSHISSSFTLGNGVSGKRD